MKLKKILASVCLAAVCILPMGVIQASNPYGYPERLYGNPSLVLASYQMDTGRYVDTSSVVAQEYNPPQYQLAANVISYDFRHNQEYETKTEYYRYNTKTGAVYVLFNGHWDGPYYSSDTTSSHMRLMDEAEIIWKTAYNMPWKW